MSNTLPTLWVLVTLVTVIGGIPYGIWIIRTAIRRDWKKLGHQILYPSIGFAVLWGATAFHNRQEIIEERRGIYGVQTDFGKSLFSFDSPRSFNGDGCSISAYELPAAIRARFKTPDARFLEEYPKRPGYRSHWKNEHWREGPYDPKFENCIHFAGLGMESYFSEVISSLTKGRTYYAFFYNGSPSNPADIDLFVIDLDSGRLYEINQNT